MRIFFAVFLIAVFSCGSTYIFPWWSLVIVCSIVSIILRLSTGKAFWVGFLGVFIFWLTMAFFRDQANDHILSNRMAQLFHLPFSAIFLVVSAMVGGLIGGISAWAGAELRLLLTR
ncbi:MAG: hypothetical protein JSS64_10685 [Bacteroidetes bacterium]|nr:hypothetical protein [Bacteroidota bacterium]